MARRKFEAIGSTADIAFLLLCYFLMTTTMGEQTGLQRRLPPIPDEKTAQDQKVNRRNIIIVRINSADRLFAGNEAMDISLLKEKIKLFLSNPADDPSLPEKEYKEIEGLNHKVLVSKGVISLQNDRGTSYQAYIAVQNELVKAVNELRDEFSMREFGGKKFFALSEAEQDIVKKAVPQNISEAEPKDTGKR
ncbi:MAG: biopolymer transporter ExbD [Bacteroidales bacterium]|nr:biopolymer transporter ExbD [Bacteroidales bacterium]